MSITVPDLTVRPCCHFETTEGVVQRFFLGMRQGMFHLGKGTGARAGSAPSLGGVGLVSCATTPDYTHCGTGRGRRPGLAQVAWELLLPEGDIS